ncbi:MAG: kelch repeat-containing protein [Gemmatimonadaceae bacterium]
MSALLFACTADKLTAPLVPLKPSLIIFGGKPCGTNPNPAVGGENQSGQVGLALSMRLIVQVVDAAPRNGQILNFVVTSGGGSVFANVVETANPTSGPAAGCNGIGQDTWTLGPTAGPQTVEARLVDPTNGATLTEATFHATATVSAAASLKVSAGDQQTALAGTAVTIRPAVLVTDQSGNPIAGVAVTFAVASGGGSITPPVPPTTGTNGIAAVDSWTLGTTSGTNTLTATSAGLTGSPVTFSAVGTTGDAAQLVLVSGNNQTASAGSKLPSNPTVRAVDANGNGVPNVAVTFTVTSGGGSIDGVGSVTTLTSSGASIMTPGRAAVSWTLGSASGPNTLQATAVGLSGSPLVFSATATGNSWTTKASMPTAREFLGAGAINGTLYALGGYNNGPLGTLEAYDPASNTWTTKWSMPTARFGLSVGVINGILYAVGGNDNNGQLLGTLEAYDPASNTWTTEPSMPTARAFLGVGVINGIFYAAGGYGSGNGLSATLEAYLP